MGDLSKSFSRKEFRCRCGCRRCGVDPRLVDALQDLRDRIGVSVAVLSGYRCQKHNQAVGGAKDSQHLVGRAADVKIAGVAPAEVARLAESIPVFSRGGIGIYDTFTHLDVRKTGRARWDERKDGGHERVN